MKKVNVAFFFPFFLVVSLHYISTKNKIIEFQIVYSERFRWITYLVDCIDDLRKKNYKKTLTQFLKEDDIITAICNEQNKYSAVEVSVIVKGILFTMNPAVHCAYQPFLKKCMPSSLFKNDK